MCFSFEVSLGTFVFSWSSALYLLYNKDLHKQARQGLVYILIFSSMQLLDAILWWNKMRRNNINYVVTSYLIPAVLVALIIYNVYFINNINNLYLNIFIAVFTLHIFLRFNGYSSSVCKNYISSPIWGGKELAYWEFVLFLVLFAYPSINLILFWFVFYSLIVHIFKGGYGSLWCAFANVFTIYYLYKYL
jgi:hypothetical protein